MRLAILAVAGLAACTPNPTPQTIAADALAAGTLFCAVGPQLIAATGVTVTNASASAVAAACAGVQIVGGLMQPGVVPVPVAAPVGAVAVVGTVPAPVAAAVVASRKG